jgi:NAD(P)-dependent dehydrogenase (short-subunit alcohol dehydrogenase family)
MSLEGKVVLITGAGTGIGADAARAFHNAGSFLILNGRRPAPLERTALDVEPSGKRVAIVAGDIGDPAPHG